MSASGIFLEHYGHVDLSVIELLLTKLKKTKEYASLSITTRKRTYGLFVESLENIYKHSALKSSDDHRLQPNISVREVSDKIVIVASNPVSGSVKGKLISRLDKLNQSDEVALKTMHEDKINSDVRRCRNGAGLGLIYIALKSGNKINYNFRPLTEGYLYYEIQISLNKYLS